MRACARVCARDAVLTVVLIYTRHLNHTRPVYILGDHDTDPETFINMLPSNGNMAFYLPFIEKSYRYNCARMLSKHVVANASYL